MYSHLLKVVALSGLLARGASATFPGFPDIFPDAKNFIYIVPDGFGVASQTMARDYVSLMQNGKMEPDFQLPADKLVLGNVRTWADGNLITDSAASATAFACGVKTQNGGEHVHYRCHGDRSC